jgi:hypothetical protein
MNHLELRKNAQKGEGAQKIKCVFLPYKKLLFYQAYAKNVRVPSKPHPPTLNFGLLLMIFHLDNVYLFLTLLILYLKSRNMTALTNCILTTKVRKFNEILYIALNIKLLITFNGYTDMYCPLFTAFFKRINNFLPVNTQGKKLSLRI